jgi:hypothetical protein
MLSRDDAHPCSPWEAHAHDALLHEPEAQKALAQEASFHHAVAAAGLAQLAAGTASLAALRSALAIAPTVAFTGLPEPAVWTMTSKVWFGFA